MLYILKYLLNYYQNTSIFVYSKSMKSITSKNQFLLSLKHFKSLFYNYYYFSIKLKY